MKKSISKSIIKSYLVWTYLLTYLLWGTIAIANQFGYLMYGTSISMVIFFFGGWSPTIVAYFCLKKYHKISSFKQLLRELFNVKQPAKGYITVAVYIVAYYAVLLVLGCAKQYNPLYMWIASLPITIIFGGLEELGWRYVLQPSLEEKISFWKSTIIVGVLWAMWHLPLYFIVGYESISNFPVFAIDTLAFAFALAAVRRMNNSIWLCILLHGLLNAGTRVFVINETITASLVEVVVLVAITFLVTCISDKKKNKDLLQENN